MPTVAVKAKGGETAGDIILSERVWGAPRNLPLLHQAVRTEQENARQDTRNTLTRGDILGGGRKPFRQKGTGRARQGSIVAPHWRHGGTAHGPHPRDLGHQMPKKMRRAAIFSALSAKLVDGELLIVDSLGLEGISTRAAAAFLSGLGVAGKSLVILEAANETARKSLRNLPSVTLRIAPAFSVRDVVDGGTVIVTRAAALKIESTWGDAEKGAEPSTTEPSPSTAQEET